MGTVFCCFGDYFFEVRLTPGSAEHGIRAIGDKLHCDTPTRQTEFWICPVVFRSDPASKQKTNLFVLFLLSSYKADIIKI